jgi:type VI secretion system protein ImpK
VHPEKRQVRTMLLDIINAQERKVRDDNRLAQQYDKVKYPLCVLADDILINSGWSYAREWEESNLELELFGSRIGGEEFYERLERDGLRDESVAEIFFIALSLGFAGKYSFDPEKILEYKRSLYRVLPNRYSIDETSITITPDAYFVGEGQKEIGEPVANLTRVLLICGALLIGVGISYGTIRAKFIDKLQQPQSQLEEKIFISDRQ